MRFMLTFTMKPDRSVRDDALSRFREIGNAIPSGVKLVGRWTASDLSTGFDLLETDDARALTRFCLQWNDILDVRVVPIVDDVEFRTALAPTAR